MRIPFPATEPTQFPLGTHLCREPMPPMAELKSDMRLLKKSGFSLVKIQEHWYGDEPEEGRFQFEPIEELVSYADELKLGVYLGLSCEQAPAWLWQKYPDVAMETVTGTRVPYIAQTPIPGDGKPGPCPDHPGMIDAQHRFITELVGTLGKYESIVVWNTWQEIGYWSKRLVGGETCYCPNTVEHFRVWLKNRYGSLDDLNRAWHSRHTRWDSVLPNRSVFRSCNPVDIDWRAFQEGEYISATLRRRSESIKAADPRNRPVFAHIDMPLWGASSPWAYARCQDFLGSSSYPMWFSTFDWDDVASATDDREASLINEVWDSIIARFDCVRSASAPEAPVWAAELQGGPVSVGLHWGRTPEPDDIRRWTAGLLGSDVTGISYWVTRPEIMAHEVNGYSLLDGTGDSTPRFAEVSRIAAGLHKYADLFAGRNLEPRQTGILVNDANYSLLSALAGDSEVHLGYDTRGWHRLLWESGASCDFVDMDSTSAAELAAYSLLVLPFPFSLSEAKAQSLVDYVRSGGYLVCEACAGRLDENGFSTRSGLAAPFVDLFGVEHGGLTMVREPGGVHRYSPYPRGWGEYSDKITLAGCGQFDGLSLQCSLHRESFVTRTLGETTAGGPSAGESTPAESRSEPAFMADGDVAGVYATLGKGRALLLGTYLGYQGTAHRNSHAAEFVRKVLLDAGVTTGKPVPVAIRHRDNGRARATIALNISDKPQTIEESSDGFGSAETLFGTSVNSPDGMHSVVLQPLEAEVLIQIRAGQAGHDQGAVAR